MLFHRYCKIKPHVAPKIAGLTILFGLLLPGSIALAAEQVTVTIPTFDVTLNERTMEGIYSKYPLIVYKDITYFPMTYYDSRLLGIQADWSQETGLVVTKQDGYFYEYMRDINEQKNKSRLTAKVAEGKITVNGKVIDNTKEEYPLLVCRDVTYFPLTWRFAAEEFGWDYDFTPEKGLVISNAGVKQEDPNEYEWTALPFSGGPGLLNGLTGIVFPIGFMGEEPTYSLNEKDKDSTYYYEDLPEYGFTLYNLSGGDVIIEPMEQWEYQVYRLIGKQKVLLGWRKIPCYSGELPERHRVGGHSLDSSSSMPIWSEDNIKAGQYFVQLLHPEEIIYEEVSTHTIKHAPIKSGEPSSYRHFGYQLSATVTIVEEQLYFPPRL